MSYAITGIKTGLGPSGALPLRQEIDSWSSDPNNTDQVNLYLQALAALQQIPQDQKLGYFQLAGVHGEPFQPWDENKGPNPRTKWQGYCTHASILFPTWHRPYLAAFEQMLHELMQQIVQAYPDPQLQARYQAASDTFRIPYWDSGALKTRNGTTSLNVPYLCTLPTVDVFTPTGNMTIENPLYQYKFSGPPEGVTSFQDQEGNFYPFANALGTSRYPPTFDQNDPTVTQQWTDGYVDNDSITRALQNLSSFGEDIYRSFSLNNYDWYSTTQQSNPPAPDSYQSIEAIHNQVHDLTGGGGHMSWNTVSSFDPLFWLHHANVDRLFAIWQALYAGSWFDDSTEQIADSRGTWSLPAGNRDKPSTPLSPFHKDAASTTYTSDDIRDHKVFGHSYPELQPWLPKYNAGGQFDGQAYRGDIIQQLNGLYGRIRNRFQRDVKGSTGRAILQPGQLFTTNKPAPGSGGAGTAPSGVGGLAQTKIANIASPNNPAPQQQPLGVQAQSGTTSHTGNQPPQVPTSFPPPPTQHANAPAKPSDGSLSSRISQLAVTAQQEFQDAIAAGKDAHANPDSKRPVSSSNTHGGIGSKIGSMVGTALHNGQAQAQAHGLLSSHKKPLTSSRGIESTEPVPHNAGDMTYHEYDANIRFERMALGGRPFTVHIFLGDFNPNPATWTFDKNRVGGVYNFVAGVPRGDGSKCSNCERQTEEHTIVTGQVSITNSLLDDVEDGNVQLNSLHPDEVEPYLVRNLHWRVSDPNGNDIPREQIPSLKVSVTECTAIIPEDPTEMTRFGECRVLDNVTDGRPGGKRAVDGY